MVTAVLLVHNATPQAILQFHDELSNKLPSLKGKWNFTFKVFRNNVYSIPPELVHTATTAPQNSYLYTWVPSYLNDSCVTLVNKNSAAVFSHHIEEEEVATNKHLSIPNHHLHGGATTGSNDSFDYMIGQRMQGLWTQRQVIKGDGGQSYELEGGNLVIRTANVSLHGNFRGFLIQIEVNGQKVSTSDWRSVFDELIRKYDIPRGNMCLKVIDEGHPDHFGDLALQYAETLNF